MVFPNESDRYRTIKKSKYISKIYTYIMALSTSDTISLPSRTENALGVNTPAVIRFSAKADGQIHIIITISHSNMNFAGRL